MLSLRLIEREIRKCKTSHREMIKRTTRLVACLYYNLLAKPLCLACENEFHSKQKLKRRNTFPFQALAYASYTQRHENSKLLSRNLQKNRLSHIVWINITFHTTLAKTFYVWLVNTDFQWKLNKKHLPFKHFFTPHRIRDKNQFFSQNFPSQNRENNKRCIACFV